MSSSILERLCTWYEYLRNIASESARDPVPAYKDDERELIECLKRSIRDWETANMNFEHADSDELVDYYAYEIKAMEVKYQYLLKKVKEKGINIENENLVCLPEARVK